MYQGVIFLLVLGGALGQIPLKGPCDVKSEQVVVLNETDVINTLGVWYQVLRIPNSNERGECSTSLFGMLTPTLGYVAQSEVENGVPRVWYGSVTRDSATPEKFIINFDSVPRDYYILTTNYKDYTLLYSCQNTDAGNRNIWAWLMVRSRTYVFSLQDLKEIEKAVNLNPDLLQASWTSVAQDNC